MKQIAVIGIVFLVGFAPAPAAAPPPPDQVVAASVRELAALVADCRAPLAVDPVAMRGVVDRQLRPKVDVLYAGQLILGRHWSEADPDQRRRFAEALYGSLVARYSSGLLLLTDRNVTVVPATGRPGADDGEAEVELRIDARLAAPIPVFLQLRRGSDRWRVYDARWEGQSYLLSLRNAFAQEIRRDGLETVIRRLEASAGAAAGPPEARETAAGRCLRGRQART